MLRAFRITTVIFALVLAIFFLAFANPQAANAQSTTAFSGEYFNNINFTSPPTLVRDDPQINFDWGNGSPDPSIPADNFSVRWKRWYYIGAAGPYTFTMTTDDGSRLWIDGTLVIDMFYDHAPLTRATTKNLGVGYHLLRMDYYERTGGALAQLTITSAASFPDWKGEYFNNQTLSGSPALTVNNVAINFNWGTGSPDPSIPADHFSVRWTRNYNFAAGTYRFTATADDGIRVWVGSTLLIDQWHDQSATTYTADITLGAGVQPLRVEYYENTINALAQVSWASAPPSTGAWTAQYFNNPYLSGAPVLVRNDAAVDFNWGSGSPGAGVPSDNFSAKWDSVRNAPTPGYYTVYARSDDGVRVFVDGVAQINAWFDQSATTTYSSTFYLTAGSHNWHVEYYEHTGGAEVHLTIVPGTLPPPPPPSGDVIVDDGGAGWLKGGNPSSWRSAPGYGGHSYWTFNNAFIQPLYDWARWYPSLSQARNYEVFVYIPAGIASTHDARYWVAHGGAYALRPIAQAFYGNQWVSLGTYYFNAAGGENVSLSDVTYECYLCSTVVWDAVKFSPR